MAGTETYPPPSTSASPRRRPGAWWRLPGSAFNWGIDAALPGARLGDIGAVIQEYAEARGCSVVRDFVGHGIGRSFHEGPQVAHFGKHGRGQRIVKGMTFTIEPMINAGAREAVIDPVDHWTARTIDGCPSAQWEHTILITNDGHEILTPWER